ncbi:type II secretion system protein F (GspF) [Marinobacter pelagius]|uniref:Type II secretion system protein F (GspF) n=1 Tax=Marinobacter pelagius TaxID=379482 RepID=A0A366GDN2_9GAMM|nr:type II secretion system F family protein [Marinobacter pelagius]RBP25054.1 type II secretion system protein F (GspF) [Marinobacter pelagius]
MMSISTQTAHLASIMFGLLAMIVLILLVLVGYWQRKRAIVRSVQRRMQLDLPKPGGARTKPGVSLLGDVFVRAGPQWSVGILATGALVALVIVAGVGLYRGVIEALITLFFFVSATFALWRMHFERRRRQIMEELPEIIDAVLRSITAGRSLEQAVQGAFSDTSDVFVSLALRLRSAIQQGRDYTSHFEHFGKMYHVPAVVQIALAIRTSARYGSSIKPLLQELAKSSRVRQEMRREFIAATAELRFTAVVFAILPPGLAVYMMVINDEFSRILLSSDAGHSMIAVAGVLQVVGSFVIWRLIKGVGRE